MHRLGGRQDTTRNGMRVALTSLLEMVYAGSDALYEPVASREGASNDSPLRRSPNAGDEGPKGWAGVRFGTNALSSAPRTVLVCNVGMRLGRSCSAPTCGYLHKHDRANTALSLVQVGPRAPPASTWARSAKDHYAYCMGPSWADKYYEMIDMHLLSLADRFCHQSAKVCKPPEVGNGEWCRYGHTLLLDAFL